MCLGFESGNFKGIPRLDIPDMTWTDGPRGPHVGVAFGATWNTDLVTQAGIIMGNVIHSVTAFFVSILEYWDRYFYR